MSTDQQAEQYGLDAQLSAIHRRAAERGYEIVRDGERDAFADDGYSGGDLRRPAMDRLRQAVRDGRVDLVLTYDPDRLERAVRDELNRERAPEGAEAARA